MSAPSPCGKSPEDCLEAARAWAMRADRSAHDALQAWVHCATGAYRALATNDRTLADAAAAMATQATAEVVSRLLQQVPEGWTPGPLQVGDVRVHIEFRRVSDSSRPPLRVRRAQDVSMDAFDGQRHERRGFGV